MPLIPRYIRDRILHDGDNAQIDGVRHLFNLLNTNPYADELRQQIVSYIDTRPWPEPLSELLPGPCE